MTYSVLMGTLNSTHSLTHVVEVKTQCDKLLIRVNVIVPLYNEQAWEKAQQNLVSRLHPNSERVVVDDADRGSVTWRRADVIVQQIRRMVLRYRSQHRQD